MLVCCCAFQIHSHHIWLQFIAISASNCSCQQFLPAVSSSVLGVQREVFVAALSGNHHCEGLLQWSWLFSLRLNDSRLEHSQICATWNFMNSEIHSLTSCSCLVIGKGRLDIFQSSNAGCHLSKHQNISEPDVSQDGNYAESLQKYSWHHSAGPLETNPERRRCQQKVLSANGSCLTFYIFSSVVLCQVSLRIRMFCLRHTC